MSSKQGLGCDRAPAEGIKSRVCLYCQVAFSYSCSQLVFNLYQILSAPIFVPRIVTELRLAEFYFELALPRPSLYSQLYLDRVLSRRPNFILTDRAHLDWTMHRPSFGSLTKFCLDWPSFISTESYLNTSYLVDQVSFGLSKKCQWPEKMKKIKSTKLLLGNRRIKSKILVIFKHLASK